MFEMAVGQPDQHEYLGGISGRLPLTSDLSERTPDGPEQLTVPA